MIETQTPIVITTVSFELDAAAVSNEVCGAFADFPSEFYFYLNKLFVEPVQQVVLNCCSLQLAFM